MRLILTIAASAALLAGQGQSGYTFTTNSELVLLDVGVSNQKGENIRGLTKDQFRVFDNGKLQAITQFSSEDMPAAAVLAIDSSESMIPKRSEVLSGGLAFVHESNPLDQISVVDFNDAVHFRLPPDIPFSSDYPVLRAALLDIRMEGRTALYDAVYESLVHLKSAREGRKTLVIISDGGDNASRHNLQDVIAAARESPATIYAVGIFDPDDADQNPGLLKNLARISGGQAFFPKEVSETSATCRQIAADIRSRYMIGYRPVRLNEGAQQRAISVTVVGAGKVKVRVRTSYYLPALSSQG
ncbi:MAG TPA: VWA domain-containing protein [Bryobacteraceae bacterium]|jgi:Ca-activated chloride channel family protein|nr:VWA domain-containing protein [Bryobacteraceae bacterium]